MKKTILRRMEEQLKRQGKAENTQLAYVRHIKAFQEHFDKPLSRLGVSHIEDYVWHLGEKHGPGSATQRLFAAAVRFLYTTTLRKPDKVAWLKVPKQRRRLVVVMTKDEVSRCIDAAPTQRDKAFVMLAVGAGLRIGEVAQLQVRDIDSAAGVIRVREGKGCKERVVMLSPPLLTQLRRYWKAWRPAGPWLFPSDFREPSRVVVHHAARWSRGNVGAAHQPEAHQALVGGDPATRGAEPALLLPQPSPLICHLASR